MKNIKNSKKRESKNKTLKNKKDSIVDRISLTKIKDIVTVIAKVIDITNEILKYFIN